MLCTAESLPRSWLYLASSCVYCSTLDRVGQSSPLRQPNLLRIAYFVLRGRRTPYEIRNTQYVICRTHFDMILPSNRHSDPAARPQRDQRLDGDLLARHKIETSALS